MSIFQGYDFEIEYPSSWEAGTRPSGELVFLLPGYRTFSDPEMGGTIATPMVELSIHERETEWFNSGDLKDHIDVFLDFKAKSFNGFKLIKKSYYETTTGETGALITYDYEIGEHCLRTVQGIVIKGKKFYEVHGEAFKKEFPQWEKDFVHVIQSLRLHESE